MKHALHELVQVSKYVGMRFDLVQAGGGNTSVKFSERDMIIKSSGVSLSEVELDRGWTQVDYLRMREIIKDADLRSIPNKQEREKSCSQKVQEATLLGGKASIEVLLHALLDTYVVHVHSLAANVILLQKSWKSLLESIFDPASVAIIEYKTPGIELAWALQDLLLDKNKIPSRIFLQNHGIIVHGDRVDDVLDQLESCLVTLEQHTQLDLNRYKLANRVAKLFEPQGFIAYLSEDSCIHALLKTHRHLFFVPPFCPDKMVYCGISAVEILSLNDPQPLKNYFKRLGDWPRVVIYADHVFFIASSVKKAREIEEVFKFHLLALQSVVPETVNPLPAEELVFLHQWDAEKYRKSLQGG